MARGKRRPKPMSPKDGIKRTSYVREGKLPRGKHEIGFKELSWSKKELDEFVKKCRTTQGLHSNPNSRIA